MNKPGSKNKAPKQTPKSRAKTPSSPIDQEIKEIDIEIAELTNNIRLTQQKLEHKQRLLTDLYGYLNKLIQDRPPDDPQASEARKRLQEALSTLRSLPEPRGTK